MWDVAIKIIKIGYPLRISNLRIDPIDDLPTNTIQWEFQDPKMEVLYHTRPYFVGIFPYIGLTQALYMVGTSNESDPEMASMASDPCGNRPQVATGNWQLALALAPDASRHISAEFFLPAGLEDWSHESWEFFYERYLISEHGDLAIYLDIFSYDSIEIGVVNRQMCAEKPSKLR